MRSGRPGGAIERRFAMVTSVTVATKLAAAGAGVLSARILGPADKGTLALSLLFVSVVAAVGFLGLDVWLLGAASPDRRPQEAALVLRRHLSFAAPAAVGTSLVLGAVGVALGWLDAAALLGVGVAVGSTVVFFPVASLLLATGAQRAFAAVMLTDCVGFVAVLGGLALSSGASVTTVITVFAFTRLAAVFVGAASWARVRGFLPAVTVTRGDLRSAHRMAVAFGIPTFLGYVLTLATYRVDSVLLGGMRSAFDVGLYTAAAAVVEFMWVVPDAAGQVLVTQVAGDPTLNVTARLTRVTVAVLVVGSAAVSLAASPIIRLVYGEAYAESAQLIPALAVAAVMLGLWKVVVGDLAGRGLSRPRAGTALIAVAGMLAADLVLIPRYGAMGAAAGSVVGYSLAAVAVVRRWTAVTGGSAVDLLVPRPSDIGFLIRRATRSTASGG